MVAYIAHESELPSSLAVWTHPVDHVNLHENTKICNSKQCSSAICTRCMFSLTFHFADYNECADFMDNHCKHECTNSFGSFQCYCHTGFELLEDGLQCERQCMTVVINFIG